MKQSLIIILLFTAVTFLSCKKENDVQPMKIERPRTEPTWHITIQVPPHALTKTDLEQHEFSAERPSEHTLAGTPKAGLEFHGQGIYASIHLSKDLQSIVKIGGSLDYVDFLAHDIKKLSDGSYTALFNMCNGDQDVPATVIMVKK